MKGHGAVEFVVVGVGSIREKELLFAIGNIQHR